MGEPVGRVARFAVGLFEFQLVDELDGGEAPNPQVVVHDGLHADGGGEMRLAGAGPADEDGVMGVLDEVAAVQRFDERGIDGAVLELEA